MNEDNQKEITKSKAKLAEVSTPPKADSARSKPSFVLISAVVSVVTALVTSGIIGSGFLLWQSQRDDASDIEQQRQVVSSEGEVIANVAEVVGSSVVSIVTTQQRSVNSQFFGERTNTTQAAGTGVIIDASGLILTNKHVVPEGTNNVQVITADGTVYESVSVLGRDPLNDLAFLKVKDPKDFKAARLGNSNDMRPGQKVIAIGNALGEFQNSVTSGIISGLGRPVSASDDSGESTEQLTNLFQTDAAINSGNSGGPLLNLSGEVIGINTAIAADAENIGFAIPINEAKGLIETVKQTGKVIRPYLGVQYVNLTPVVAKQLDLEISEGAMVSEESGAVLSGSPAAKAGIKPGDIIVQVNETKLSSTISLGSVLNTYKVGDEVTLTLIRGDNEQTVKVTLEAAPTQ